MQEHLDFSLVYEITIQNGVVATSDPSNNGPLLEEYQVDRTGPFINAGADYIGWEKVPERYRSNLSASALSDLAQFPADWQDVRKLVYGIEIKLRRSRGRV
jgi:choline dehydrogenase